MEHFGLLREWEKRPSELGWIMRSGTQRHFPWYSEKWRTLDHYALVYILEGSCSYFTPHEPERRICGGSVLLLFPNRPHYYGPTPGIPTSQTFLHYNGPLFHPWHKPGLLGPELFTVTLRPVEYWLQRFESAALAFPPGDSADPRGVCTIQLLLADILASNAGVQRRVDDDHWLGKAMSALEAVPRADLLDVYAIADQLNMSYANFRKRFTKLAKTSPVKFHSRVLMQRASQIMTIRTITDQELSEQLGISNPYRFAQRFRAVFGQTPREFRASLR